MAHEGGEATNASIIPTAASVRATAASDLIQASPGVLAINRSCYAHYAPPMLGLSLAEYALRDGFVGRPKILTGEEIGGVNPTAIVIRGGRLEQPTILFGVEEVSRQQFSCVRRLIWVSSSQVVQLTTRCITWPFTQMRGGMHKRCRAFGEGQQHCRCDRGSDRTHYCDRCGRRRDS